MGNKKGTPLFKKDEEIIKLYDDGLSTIEISKIYNVAYGTIWKLLKNNGVKLRSNKVNSRKNNYNFDYFENIDTEKKAYWLGFFFADGFIREKDQKMLGVALSTKDIDHLEKLKKDMNAEYDIKKYKTVSGYKIGIGYCRLLFFGEKIVFDVKKYGMIPNKSNILTRPKNIPKEFEIPFIRGFFDGNGSIKKAAATKNFYQFGISIVSTEDMLLWIKNILEENNICKINKFKKRRETDIVTSIDFSGMNQVRNFLSLIYDNSTIYLSRKMNIYKNCVLNNSVEHNGNIMC